MKIELKEITVRELTDGYQDNAENRSEEHTSELQSQR